MKPEEMVGKYLDVTDVHGYGLVGVIWHAWEFDDLLGLVTTDGLEILVEREGVVIKDLSEEPLPPYIRGQDYAHGEMIWRAASELVMAWDGDETKPHYGDQIELCEDRLRRLLHMPVNPFQSRSG